MSLKRTPLFESHVHAGARVVDFGGWEMPVQYAGIVAEHNCVRQAAGIFDISHMGEVRITGAESKSFLNHLLTNDVGTLFPGQGQYSIMCNESGGAIDDLYVYRTGPQEYLLVINASRIDADVPWIMRQRDGFSGSESVQVEDLSDKMAAVAIQGPNAAVIVDQLFPGPSMTDTRVDRPSGLAKNELGRFLFGTDEVWVSRTGYTGEDGFEIITPNAAIVPLWEMSIVHGAAHGLQPAGLGARDTLRTEMCYPLYGHELNEQTSPISAGIGFFVNLNKGEFIGRTALAAEKEAGPERKLVAFVMTGKSAPPRPHYRVFVDGAPVGETTSGTVSPSMNNGIGLAYLPAANSKVDTAIEIEIRNRLFPARIVRKPIYKKSNTN
ncbi:MAG: glycine cleavage system aminomethyltransferase GcvT [Verrucomicrobiae bacterium]|nr:glycine cleavage system aminomethyltransferase GcvT [Verrucomicrobiae bacterium]